MRAERISGLSIMTRCLEQRLETPADKDHRRSAACPCPLSCIDRLSKGPASSCHRRSSFSGSLERVDGVRSCPGRCSRRRRRRHSRVALSSDWTFMRDFALAATGDQHADRRSRSSAFDRLQFGGSMPRSSPLRLSWSRSGRSPGEGAHPTAVRGSRRAPGCAGRDGDRHWRGADLPIGDQDMHAARRSS